MKYMIRKMILSHMPTRRLLYAFYALILIATYVTLVQGKESISNLRQLTAQEIEDELQVKSQIRGQSELDMLTTHSDVHLSRSLIYTNWQPRRRGRV